MTDACASNPCLNGGTCFPFGSRFFCSCPNTHTGIRCETLGKKVVQEVPTVNPCLMFIKTQDFVCVILSVYTCSLNKAYKIS